MSQPLLEARSISKSFGPVKALDQVNLAVQHGEIHSVLGENGAGKSTLMNVICGFLTPDSGSMLLKGQEVHFANPSEARKAGIGIVHQHFMLVPQFTVLENLILDQMTGLSGLLDSGQIQSKFATLAESVGWKIDFNSRIVDLSVGQQQRIEILKVLGLGTDILILDEPTAVLSAEEIDDLFRVMRTVKSQGKTIILIAHKLAEVMEISDHATVLRRGRLIGSARMSELSVEKLTDWMVGELPDLSNDLNYTPGQVLVTVENLKVKGDRGETAVDISELKVHAGEVLGIAGVDGNGQIELAEALAGVRPIVSGSLNAPSKIAYIPQDRQRDGLALSMSIAENFLVGIGKSGFLNPKALREESKELAEKFQLKYGNLEDPASSLSGGNQQKVILARTLSQSPEFIIAVNPTRGLDLKAAAFVQSQILAAARSGSAVVLISTDLDEVSALADRTLFISGGKLKESTKSEYLGGSN